MSGQQRNFVNKIEDDESRTLKFIGNLHVALGGESGETDRRGYDHKLKATAQGVLAILNKAAKAIGEKVAKKGTSDGAIIDFGVAKIASGQGIMDQDALYIGTLGFGAQTAWNSVTGQTAKDANEETAYQFVKLAARVVLKQNGVENPTQYMNKFPVN